MFRSLRSLANYLRPIVYKHFVPNGTKTVLQQLAVTMDKSSTLTKHYQVPGSELTLFCGETKTGAGRVLVDFFQRAQCQRQRATAIFPRDGTG